MSYKKFIIYSCILQDTKLVFDYYIDWIITRYLIIGNLYVQSIDKIQHGSIREYDRNLLNVCIIQCDFLIS